MSQHVYSMSEAEHRPRRVSVEDAARVLGISENAVRKRIERGTLESERDGDARYVLLEGDMPQHANDMSDGMPDSIALMQAHLDSLAGQLAFLRMELEARTEEARRKDHIIMSLTQRVPELESPRDEPQAPETPAESSEGKDTPNLDKGTQEATERRSWWRRWFGA